ncbi:MAG TPA: lytic transglycosylase domain-containing protein, partial [Streptomyces sp.]|nr:lytic transglycosylase domain-containing protein [Streptomyces sp.]
MTAHFGKRLRKGAATTAVAAAAVAALAASQAPGADLGDQGRQSTADTTPSPDANADSATGNSPYYTGLPPLNSPKPSPADGTSVAPGSSEAGIPATVLDAYKKAEAALRESKPGCNLPWQLLAAIGKVESGQARGGRVRADGTTISPIIGPQLDGNGFALIKDTDNGVYDGNSRYDNAVGPMQFIPSTWAWAGRDGNDDGKKDPNNVYDAALAAGHYLCRFGWDLSAQADMNRAILSYNNSQDYLHTVLSWLEYYRKGSHEIPDGTGALPGGRSDDGQGPGSGPVTRPPSSPTPKPEEPGKPGGSQSPKPPSDTPTTPPPTTPAPTPTDTVHHLEDAGTETLTAMTGDGFMQRIGTRAETAKGTSVAAVRVRFTIVGDTDAAFANGESVATVATNSLGIAYSPYLRAGEKTGEFTIRATVVGRSVPAVDYSATVTERAADALARTDQAALTCVAGGEFASQVEVRATHKGNVADGVAATATLVKSADDPNPNDKGPHFRDAAGNPLRSLTGLKTDENGLLKLPKL